MRLQLADGASRLLTLVHVFETEQLAEVSPARSRGDGHAPGAGQAGARPSPGRDGEAEAARSQSTAERNRAATRMYEAIKAIADAGVMAFALDARGPSSSVLAQCTVR